MSINWKNVEQDVDSGPLGLFKWVVILFVAICVIAGGIGFFSINAERVIVESSYIYKAGASAEVASIEATIEELQIRLERDPNNVELIDQLSFHKAKLRSLEYKS